MKVRALFNRGRRWLVRHLHFRIVFGETSQGRWLPHTRISPSTCIEHENRLTLADHVYIGPFNVIEASGGVVIGEGVQITSHVSIVTHSSHRAQRMLGREFAAWVGDKPGWVSGPVEIGAYCFIGPHVVIEPNTRIGRGCIVRAGAVVRGAFADFGVLQGQPAQVVGDARDGDEKLLAQHPQWRERYLQTFGRTSPDSDR
jgi:acetyltransferase-like isoleucine patch superfamily enzyme